MDRQESRVHRSIRWLRVGHFHFRAALRSRASRYVLVVASPSSNQMGVVNCWDCSKVSNNSMKLKRERAHVHSETEVVDLMYW